MLVAFGGTATLLVDYRHKLFSLLPGSRRQTRDSGVQLQDLSTRGPSPVQEDAPASTTASLSQRRVAQEPLTTATSEVSQEAIPERTETLMILDKRLAALTGLGFVLLVVIPLAVRGGMQSPPVSLDFFSNMVIAGVIIFGASSPAPSDA